MRQPASCTETRIYSIDHRVTSIARLIHAIHQAAYAQEAVLLDATRFPPLERTVEDLRALAGQFIGAFQGAHLVGALGVEAGEGHGATSIASLAIAPAWQRRGIGRRLMAAVVARHGSGPMSLQTGAANAPALALYAAFGFVECRRWVVGSEPLHMVSLRRAGRASADPDSRAAR